MFMQAVVQEVQRDRLLVLDLATRQSVFVNTPAAWRFRPGDRVNIWYTGVMTNSIPPQITALYISPVPPDGLGPAPCPPGRCPPPFRPPVIVPPVFRPPWRR